MATRTGVLSDVHGNLEALQEVLREGGRLGIDRWLSLGDIVGYGADPEACLTLILEHVDWSLLGNHDAAVAGVQGHEYFNRYARQAVAWTREQLSDSSLKVLSDLPLTYQETSRLYAHAEPSAPGDWHYVDDARDAKLALATVDSAQVFVGHSHVGFVFAQGSDRLVASREGRIAVDSGRYLINVGSVGQPRDGDPRACFAVCDDEQGTIELIRISYDLRTAQDKIRGAGLPEFLADRLTTGS
ncbi:MAG: metallophosphoesterase family protein [Candidatus Latescibacterota bacterium]|nr:metallophosphoesterase family protein [Candidatus Latescibacterota bacterium]